MNDPEYEKMSHTSCVVVDSPLQNPSLFPGPTHSLSVLVFLPVPTFIHEGLWFVEIVGGRLGGCVSGGGKD